MVRGKVIPNWSAAFGEPGIIVLVKDSIFIGGIFQAFRTARNIVSQTVIPGHRQSSGAAERRRGNFRTIIDHMIGNKTPNSSRRKEWWGIRGNEDDASKFTGGTIWRIHTWAKRFWSDTENAYWRSGQSAF